MPGRKKYDGGCVTRQECVEAMEPLRNTLETVKNALVGQNLTGGLVKQMSDLSNKVTNLITQREEEKSEKKEKHEETLKWKMAALGLAASFLGFLLEFVFNHFAH